MYTLEHEITRVRAQPRAYVRDMTQRTTLLEDNERLVKQIAIKSGNVTHIFYFYKNAFFYNIVQGNEQFTISGRNWKESGIQ